MHKKIKIELNSLAYCGKYMLIFYLFLVRVAWLFSFGLLSSKVMPTEFDNEVSDKYIICRYIAADLKTRPSL